jgi:DNA-binding response OmpR family regulator
MAYVLLATDADWIADEVAAAIAGPEHTVGRIRAGEHVTTAVRELEPDVVILDLQIGNMGGFAACMAIRHEEGANRIPITAVLMLLDRAADVFLARRADADGWITKPVDALKLRRAVATLLTGRSWEDGVVPADPAAEPDDGGDEADEADAAAS